MLRPRGLADGVQRVVAQRYGPHLGRLQGLAHLPHLLGRDGVQVEVLLAPGLIDLVGLVRAPLAAQQQVGLCELVGDLDCRQCSGVRPGTP